MEPTAKKMKIVFIADAHLKGLDDPDQKSLVKFLDNLSADVLVVLGDLFDFWTGFNEVVYYHYLPVLSSLLELKEKGTRIIYLEGNHDFTMGAFFTDVLKAEVYPESCELPVDGKLIYLSHGDTIAAGAGHRVWRGFLRTRAFRMIARAAAPQLVWRIAVRLSKKSRRYNKGSDALEARLKEFAGKKIAGGADSVVLGHSHVACVCKVGEGRGGCYANPGSWAGGLNYLVYNDGKFKAERWKG